MLEPNFSIFPIIETERLILRRTIIEDAGDVLILRSDIDAMKFIGRPRARTMEDSLDLIMKIENGLLENEAIGWAITLKHQLKLIGTIGYHRIEKAHYRAEIGYMIKPEFWQKGIMSEAMAPILEFGFQKMHLHSIEAHVNSENISSVKLLEKFNFIREGYFRENYYFNGKFSDTAIYSLINK